MRIIKVTESRIMTTPGQQCDVEATMVVPEPY